MPVTFSMKESVARKVSNYGSRISDIVYSRIALHALIMPESAVVSLKAVWWQFLFLKKGLVGAVSLSLQLLRKSNCTINFF